MIIEAALHHDPVDGARQIHVCSEEHDVLALQRSYRLRNRMLSACKLATEPTLWLTRRCSMTSSKFPLHLHEAPGQGQTYGRNSHWSIEQPVRRFEILSVTFVAGLFRMKHLLVATIRLVLARKVNCRGNFFHRQIANLRHLSTTCWA